MREEAEGRRKCEEDHDTSTAVVLVKSQLLFAAAIVVSSIPKSFISLIVHLFDLCAV